MIMVLPSTDGPTYALPLSSCVSPCLLYCHFIVLHSELAVKPCLVWSYFSYSFFNVFPSCKSFSLLISHHSFGEILLPCIDYSFQFLCAVISHDQIWLENFWRQIVSSPQFAHLACHFAMPKVVDFCFCGPIFLLPFLFSYTRKEKSSDSASSPLSFLPPPWTC